MRDLRIKIPGVLAMTFGSLLVCAQASAEVRETCPNGVVCGRSTYDGTRVNIYLRHNMTGATHYNFKTNPGAQIELNTGNYSFAPRPGTRGTYSAQICRRGGFGQRSWCSTWATFRWEARR
jgi:hypothetical protein